MNNHAESISQAEAIHAEMVARLASAREALAENDARRHGLALAVETGDAGAKREAAALTKAAASLREDIDRLTHAVEQAAARVATARLEANLEAKRQAATRARPISTRLEERGQRCAALLNEFREMYSGIQSDLDELTAIGAPGPSRSLVDVNLRRALDAVMDGIHSKTRPVRPSQRHPLDELCRGYARPSALWAAQILDASPSVIRVVREVAA